MPLTSRICYITLAKSYIFHTFKSSTELQKTQTNELFINGNICVDYPDASV